MNLKKKVTLHLDAVLVIGFLFVVSIMASTYMLFELKALAKQTMQQQIEISVNELNLSSQKGYINKIQKECGIEEND